MKEIKEIHPTQQLAKDSGDWEIVKPVTATITKQSNSGFTLEWICEIPKDKLLEVQKILKVQKIDVKRANEIYRLIREGKSGVDICRIKRGQKGYRLGTIKRYSSAISKVFKWKRNIAVSKNK